MNLIKDYFLHFALIISTVSTLGSLYFSEFLKLPPCSLCWYQRIFMFPIMIIILVGLWKKDKNVAYFVLPFSIIGMIISLYHNLLYTGFISESFQPCSIGISCTTKQLELLGFISIPLLSLLSFILITIFVLLYKNNIKNK